MKDKIQKLIAEIIGDGFTVEVKPVAVKPVSGSVFSVASNYGDGVIDESSVLKPLSIGNVSSDFGAGVTTYLSVYTDDDAQQAIYVNGKLELSEDTIYGPDVVRVADGRLVRMRSSVLSESVDVWPENESELIDMIGGHQSGIDAGSAIGAPHGDCLVLRSEWNAKEGCFEDSIVEPEKEPDWQPKPYEWVRLPDGTVRQHNGYEIHGTKKYYRFEGINSRFELGTLKPWTPSVGDWVKVIRENSMNRGLIGTVKRDDGKYSASYLVETKSGMGWFTAKCLEPAEPPADYIPDATKTANHSETPNSSIPDPGYFDDVEGVWVDEPEPFDGRKVEPVKEPQYREPTYADLANGPIEVEVCYDNTLETNWGKRILYAVLPVNVILRFVCEDPVIPESIYRWKHARVKVR